MAQKKRRKGSNSKSRVRRLQGSNQAEAKKQAEAFWHGKNTLAATETISRRVLGSNGDEDGPDGGTANGTAEIMAQSHRGGSSASAEGEILPATATVRSLGPAPLAGRETIAEHYFEAIYQRATMMAAALLDQAS